MKESRTDRCTYLLVLVGLFVVGVLVIGLIAAGDALADMVRRG